MKRTSYIDSGTYLRKAMIRECSPKWSECFTPGDFLDIALLLTLLTVCLVVSAL